MAYFVTGATGFIGRNLVQRLLSRTARKQGSAGDIYVLMTPQLAGVARTDLGAPAGSLAEQRQAILAALDFLIVGF